MSKDLNQCNLDKAISEYKAGCTITKFGEIAGMPKSSARTWLIKNGLKRKSKWGAFNKRIVILWNKGKTVGEIASKVPVTSTQVRRVLQNKGIFNPHRHAKGTQINSNGYLEYTIGKNKGRNVHSVTFEKRIGRRLLKDEVVHHIDGDKTNNNIDNLSLMTNSAHIRLHRFEDELSGNQRRRNKNGTWA